MSNQTIKEEELEESYKDFVSSNNSVSHRKAIEKILGMTGLRREFKRSLKYGIDKVNDTYCNFGEAAGEKRVKEEEREPIRKVGALFRKFYKNKDYRNFVDTGYMMILRNLVDTLKLKELKNYDKLTDDDLYKKGLLPREIFLQYFLIESMVKNKSFDWNRDQRIIEQNLICFDVCFSDIYAFFNGR